MRRSSPSSARARKIPFIQERVHSHPEWELWYAGVLGPGGHEIYGTGEGGQFVGMIADATAQGQALDKLRNAGYEEVHIRSADESLSEFVERIGVLPEPEAKDDSATKVEINIDTVNIDEDSLDDMKGLLEGAPERAASDLGLTEEDLDRVRDSTRNRDEGLPQAMEYRGPPQPPGYRERRGRGGHEFRR